MHNARFLYVWVTVTCFEARMFPRTFQEAFLCAYLRRRVPVSRVRRTSPGGMTSCMIEKLWLTESWS